MVEVEAGVDIVGRLNDFIPERAVVLGWVWGDREFLWGWESDSLIQKLVVSTFLSTFINIPDESIIEREDVQVLVQMADSGCYSRYQP
jgi:hypothetical protein